PAVTLLISGGHTELILMKEWMQYEYLGRTRDDAVGEAFDKVARMLGLPYPGGPHISRLAEDARQNNLPRTITLPRPMLKEDTYDFSFSGLKTAVLRFTEQQQTQFEDAVTEVLIAKTIRAVEEFGVNTVVVGGGVSANTHIRLRLTEALAEAGVKLLLCPVEYSTDNAVMIALAGYFHALKKEFAEPDTLRASGNLLLA
ncbi:MAG: putative tRNA threonylcarbamoyladenosine biosynthesis protein Gcp, partial [Candidatus Kaiserbacteria bacterium GW2011_GWC2_49_12]